MNISAREVALIAVFASMSWIVSEFVPGIPIIGAEGSRISWDASLAPIYGIIIGPYLGFVAALIGGLVAAGSLFTVLTSFCTGVSAFVAGMLTYRSNTIKEGWIFSAVTIALLLVGWYSTEVGRIAPFYPIPHIIGLLMVLSIRGWIAEKVIEGKSVEKTPLKQFDMKFFTFGLICLFSGLVLYVRHSTFIQIIGGAEITSGTISFLAYATLIAGALSIAHGIFSWIKLGFVAAIASACYCGIIADHMLGNLIFLGMINIVAPSLKDAPSQAVAGIFMTVLPVSIVERILLTAIATTIAAALLPTLRRAGIYHGGAK